MKRFFPANIDGFGASIAFKRLHPNSHVVLVGEKLDILSTFPQVREVEFESGDPQSAKCETTKCLSCTAKFVLEMRDSKMIPSIDDAKLFAFAIYSKTSALTDESTTSGDVEALAFCFRYGAKLSGIPPQFRVPIEWHVKAADIMTKSVRTVSSNLNLREVLNVVNRTGLTGFPVIDSNERVIGVVTKKDVERALKANVDNLQMVMSIPPIVASPNDSIEKVGELMTIHDVGRVIVVGDDAKPVGIITRRDLMRAISTAMGSTELVLNVSQILVKNVSRHLLNLLKNMGKFASLRGEKIYVVGGFVRDLLLGKPSLDVDAVLEGNGVNFAREFASFKGTKCRVHPEFGTATLSFNGISIDIATARTEYYEMPGALPKVEVSNLRKDLYRRDFTINAMAISLNPESFGTLIDFFGGKQDLKNGKIRVLHGMSFVEDPTRILRALRYAARFGYSFGEKTEKLLLDAIKRGYLKSVSSARIRAEFERTLKEDKPSVSFELFQHYGVFKIFPCVRVVNFSRYFELVKKMNLDMKLIYSVFLLLLKPCTAKMAFEIMENYGVPKRFREVFEDVYDERTRLTISNPSRPSELYFMLSRFPTEALPVLAYNEEMEENVFKYLRKMVKLRLEKVTGRMLKTKYGLEGREIQKVLNMIMRLKIDEKIDEMDALDRVLKRGGKC